MKIFVTTGTTEFVELIEAVLTLSEEYEAIVQTPITYESTVNCKFFGFVNNVTEYYQWADVIITHAGAGSVYKLLELGKKVLVVPNLTRKDKHQSQLADYVRDSNYGAVCYDLNELEAVLQDLRSKHYSPYRKESFYDINGILDLFKLKSS
ncbi:PssE/Cps14G family polysaccharide biosynthesis glycosyltransferase [Pseudoalteromonas prydzensis]|uniref:PssE/Cps14G family polysaccharide biosynthesis glycosyltransferase n=1 Tax=Pseudoalteromonas prydzensis TaxID=182141 RepID=UPI003FD06A1F